MKKDKFKIRPISKQDKLWVRDTLIREWGSLQIVSRGKVFTGDKLPGFVAESEDQDRLGLITYFISGEDCEIVTLNSFFCNKGIGTALIEKVKNIAISNGCNRIFVVTTNNNLEAQKFYQNRGFILKRIYPNAVENSRKLKPQIPFKDEKGRLIKDEIELEIILIL